MSDTSDRGATSSADGVTGGYGGPDDGVEAMAEPDGTEIDGNGIDGNGIDLERGSDRDPDRGITDGLDEIPGAPQGPDLDDDGPIGQLP